MNYQKIYNQLIQKAKSEDRQKRKFDDKNYVYYEAHHIIPKCLGGEGHQSQWKFHENIVLLTAREHFICHKLLCEIYQNNKKILYSFWCLATLKKNAYNSYSINKNDYDTLKKQFSKQNSIDKKNNKNRLGIKFNNESKKKISDSLKGKKQKIIVCPYCNLVGGAHALKQFHFDNCLKNPENKNIKRIRKNYIKKNRIKCTYCNFTGTECGVKKYHEYKCINNPNKKIKKSSVTIESNIKRSNTMKGKNSYKHKKVKCPYCNICGGYSIMQRHHFNNCKLKNKI